MGNQKRWTEMSPDEQVPPYRWLVEEKLLRDELDSLDKDKAVESDVE